MVTTKTNTHADPLLGSRWAQMWAYMWAEQLVIFWYMLPKVTLAAEKLQIRCIMDTHVITIKPPLQIVDISNGCKAYAASIYIPAKSELTTTLQSIT